MSKRLAPDALGYSIDLYRALYEDDMRAHALEIDFFQCLDDKAAGALQQLNEPDLGNLPPEALEVWRHFILGLLHRSPAYFANVMTVEHRHYQAALERLEKEYPSRRSANDPLTYDRVRRANR